MNIYEQFYELHDVLISDDKWNHLLEETFEDMEVGDVEELVDKCIEDNNEGLIYDLVSEAELIISLKNQIVDEWYSSESDDDDY